MVSVRTDTFHGNNNNAPSRRSRWNNTKVLPLGRAIVIVLLGCLLCSWPLSLLLLLPDNNNSSLSAGEDLNAALFLVRIPTQKINNIKEKEESNNKNRIVLDILSIGSNSRLDYLLAQKETFGSHAAVRHFFNVTEDDDTEATCHQDLTMDHLQAISNFCRSRKNKETQQQQGRPLDDPHNQIQIQNQIQNQNQNESSHTIFKRKTASFASMPFLRKKSNPSGWMCAQKRPVDGFYKLMMTAATTTTRTTTTTAATRTTTTTTTTTNHARGNYELPDFLLVTDDDTWVNTQRLVDDLPQLLLPVLPLQQQYDHHHHPSSNNDFIAYAVAGCMIRPKVKYLNLTFPFGGYGVILSRGALQNFLKPINCGNTNTNTNTNTDTNTNEDEDEDEDEFIRLACWRLVQNNIGERPLFRDGMSVLDLMYAYTFDQSYVNVHKWNTEFGSCFHSDWTWGYFINFYHIAIPTGDPLFKGVVEDRLRPYRPDSVIYVGKDGLLPARGGECDNTLDQGCTSESSLCHRISPEHMYKLHSRET